MGYWCAEKLVVRVSGPEGDQEIALDQPFAQVGSHARSHIVLNSPGVRKRAIMLLAMERGIYCVHFDLEGVAPEIPGHWLEDDEPIVIGPYTLTARLASGAPLAEPGWNPQKARSAPPIPVLHIVTGGLLKDRRRIRHPLTLIGRRPQCSLRLMGEIVSSYHCLLYWCGQRLWCIDLTSSNGTRLGDELIDCRELALGEQVEVGEFSLVYYRWSPRRLTPGIQPDDQAEIETDDEPLEAAFESSLEAAAALTSDVNSPSEDLLAAREKELKAQEERFQELMAAQQAEIERQRHELERQQEQTSAQFSDKIRALEADAQRLADERDVLVHSRVRWEQERDTLTCQLISRSEELARLEAELAAAREVLASRESRAAEPAASPEPDEDPVPALNWRLADHLPAVDVVPEAPSVQLTAASAAESSSPVLEEATAVATEARPVASLPAGRRRTEPKEELTSFVSGRLGDMEDTRRRRAMVVWAAIAVTVVATAAAGLGLWFWLS